MPQTIALKGHCVQKEATAGATITPGMLVELVPSSSNPYTTQSVRPHSTVGAAARKAFAFENDLIGNGITDNYSSGDNVKYGVAESGAEIYAILHAGTTCHQGDALESAGDGTLVPVSSPAYQHTIVGWALEAQATAGGRVRIEAA